MCGIAGFIGKNDEMHETINSMHSAIEHRGPDSSGTWMDEELGIALGHQRLAIQDLSEAGHQPMRSRSNRFVIIFNGEIYNHFDLRDSLEKSSSAPIVWNGHSDTETLVTSFELIGIQETLSLVKGMFAFALWDTKDKVLTLARDRIGEKPLFYGFVKNNLVFGSELKAIKRFPNFTNEISKDSLVSFFKYNYIPAPASIYEDIYKLRPGHLIQFNAYTGVDKSEKSHPYWSYSELLQSAKSNQFSSANEANESLESSIENSVKSQAISDVPLGAFLSGGIDSSLVVALMQKNSMTPTKTFTIGFKDASYNEAPYASAVANHLKTDHQEIILDEDDAMNAILRIPEIYDEPFADSSQIPMYLVSKMTREHVTVALSGDGGDELLGGYNRYTHTPNIWAKLRLIPFSLRKIAGKSLLFLSIQSYDSFGARVFTKRPIPQFGGKVHKIADRMQRINSLADLCVDLSTIWTNPNRLVKGMETDHHENYSASLHGLNFLDSEVSQMMALDTLTYLPDDILCKVDRAAMAVSLETRVPLLDIGVIETAARIPLHMKIKNYKGKIPLRTILSKYVPDRLIDRPKAGFAIPVGDWLRGPLRDWAESLLDESAINERGLLNFEPIQEIWLEHMSGQHDWSPKLWSILMFQAWLKEIDSSN